MDWQDTTPDYGGTNPVQPIVEVICACLCVCCIRFPRISFTIIAGITCWICFSFYLSAQDTPATWTSFTDSDTDTYFQSGTFGYLDGRIWIYGDNDHSNIVYYIDINDEHQDTFHLQQASNITTNYSFKNYYESISDKISQSIWSLDASMQNLVSFNPYSETTKLYNIPNYYNEDKFFWPACMTIDEEQRVLYIFGGYNNQTNYYDYNQWGEILTFNLITLTWDKYYSADDIGYLNTPNGYNINSYSCVYNSKLLFAFGGAYSYPMQITNSIHYIDLNENDVRWKVLENVTLNLSLIDSTAYIFDEDVHILAGCDSHSQCYVAQQIFNLPTMRVTDYIAYKSLSLPNGNVNYYVINNYDESKAYIMYSEHNNLITCYFHDKIDAVKNQIYLIVAVSCIIVVVGVGLQYYNNQSKNTGEENEPLN